MGKDKTRVAGKTAGRVASVFDTLFGSVSDPNSSNSIFSGSNPFRRNSREHVDDAEKENRKGKRKDIGEKSESMTGVSRKPLQTEKSENRKQQHDLEYEIGEKSEEFGPKNANLDVLVEKRRKKKRKRDEIEEEAGEVLEEMNLDGVKVAGSKRKTLDNASESMVIKEGFDDENKLLRTVFVGNLPLKVKKKAVLKEFSQFGEVESVRIRSVPLIDTKIPRKGAILRRKMNDSGDSVHAYIVFKTEQSAKASLSHNMSVISGNHIRVDRACPPRKKSKGENSTLYDIKRTLFMGNLPFDVKDEEVYTLFSQVKNLENSIEAVRVVRDPQTSAGKGIGYVLFKTKNAADLAVKKRNLKLRDRELRLSRARAFSTTTKRKAAFSSREDVTAPSKKPKSKSPLSYQGLKATKSGTSAKKQPRPKLTQSVKPQQLKVSEGRKRKRPAVAARKAAMKRGGSTVEGKKRKAGNWTPDRPKKKAKRSK